MRCSSVLQRIRTPISRVRRLQQGKHIFCEKPVDLTVEKIKKVIDAVDKAGVKLQIGFNRRYDHNFAYIKKLEQDGKIGKIQTIKNHEPVIPSRRPSITLKFQAACSWI